MYGRGYQLFVVEKVDKVIYQYGTAFRAFVIDYKYSKTSMQFYESKVRLHNRL